MIGRFFHIWKIGGEAGAEFDRGYKAAEFFDSLNNWKKDYLKKLEAERLACIRG